MPLTSTRNHFSNSGRSTGSHDVVGEVRVEAELVDLVVAGHPPPQELGRRDDLVDDGIPSTSSSSTPVSRRSAAARRLDGAGARSDSRRRGAGTGARRARRTTRPGRAAGSPWPPRRSIDTSVRLSSTSRQHRDARSALYHVRFRPSIQSTRMTGAMPAPGRSRRAPASSSNAARSPVRLRIRVVSRPQPNWK